MILCCANKNAELDQIVIYYNLQGLRIKQTRPVEGCSKKVAQANEFKFFSYKVFKMLINYKK